MSSELAVLGQLCTGLCCHQFYIGDHTGESFKKFADSLPDDSNLREVSALMVVMGPKLDGKGTFNCRHWDTVTGKCIIYSRRPDMCIRFPYDGECKACGLKSENLNCQ